MKIKTTHRHSHRLPQGFTLTELLVVILIIVVLAALSITGISKFRSAADKTTSMRNLAQLQTANASYATDLSPDWGIRIHPVMGWTRSGTELSCDIQSKPGRLAIVGIQKLPYFV